MRITNKAELEGESATELMWLYIGSSLGRGVVSRLSSPLRDFVR